MTLPSEQILELIAVVAALLLCGWLGARWMHRRPERADPWAAADKAPVRAIAAEPVTALMDSLDGLPSADTLTHMMAALRADCPTCGKDHIGECEDKTTVAPARRDATLTPDPGQWHWDSLIGHWQAPASLWQDLPREDWLHPGEPHWLRLLLAAA